MAIAPTLEKYLAAKNVGYDVIAHEPTSSSVQTAKACRISGDWLAKAVLLRPTTKREADVVAFKLFCLFSFILVGMITTGIL